MARLEYAYQEIPTTTLFRAESVQVPAVLFGGLATSFANTKVDAQGIANLRIGVGGENWRVTAFAET